MLSKIYEAQVDMLLEILPIIIKHPSFAVKGGSALNLFYLDMPRLSVDIDLCYLPIQDRNESFKKMHRMLAEIQIEVKKTFGFDVLATKPLDGKRTRPDSMLATVIL